MLPGSKTMRAKISVGEAVAPQQPRAKRKAVSLEVGGDVMLLDIIVQTMRAVWRAATADGKIIDYERARDAVVLAEKCAPYMHARLTSTKQVMSSTMTLEQLVLSSLREPEPPTDPTRSRRSPRQARPGPMAHSADHDL